MGGWKLYWRFSHPRETFCCDSRPIPFFQLFTSSIGEELGLDKYSEEAVKYYLIGGEIWDNEEKRNNIVKRFTKKVKESAEEEMKENPKKKDFIKQTYTDIPKEAPLTHNFFAIHFGYLPETMDYCKVSLVKVSGNGESVKYNKLFYDKEEGRYNYEFVDVRDIYFPYYELKDGYYLAHRGIIFYKPTDKEVSDYFKDLNRVLDVVSRD